jgi:hypothetical protein
MVWSVGVSRSELYSSHLYQRSRHSHPERTQFSWQKLSLSQVESRLLALLVAVAVFPAIEEVVLAFLITELVLQTCYDMLSGRVRSSQYVAEHVCLYTLLAVRLIAVLGESSAGEDGDEEDADLHGDVEDDVGFRVEVVRVVELADECTWKARTCNSSYRRGGRCKREGTSRVTEIFGERARC